MNALAAARHMLAVRLEQVKDAKEALVDVVSECFLTCKFCTRRSKVKTITLIQTYFFVEPYSCTGGDYWNVGEKEFNCPKCGKRNRTRNNSRFKELSEHEAAFADVEDEHER